ncbi:MAG: hypothetical protein PVI59_02215 [Anaerolineae bacterium]
MSAPQAKACRTLYALSTEAAAVTGSLALMSPEDRPPRAREAARRIRRLAPQAAYAPGGLSLAGVLNDLAQAVDAYAAGAPASLTSIREASARNAELRHTLRDCSGGLTYEN